MMKRKRSTKRRGLGYGPDMHKTLARSDAAVAIDNFKISKDKAKSGDCDGALANLNSGWEAAGSAMANSQGAEGEQATRQSTFSRKTIASMHKHGRSAESKFAEVCVARKGGR